MRISDRNAPWVRLSALACGAALASCSSSDDGDTPPAADTTAPSSLTYVQDRANDATGQTVAITFDEVVTAASAEDTAKYTVSGGLTVQTAVLRLSGMVVDVTLDGVAIPGTHTIDVAPGIEDAAGNASAQVTAAALTSTDTAAPAASSMVATSISGSANDTLGVVFDDDMIESEVESTANWTVESPLGTTFDITGATIDYVPQTRTATVTLGAGSVDQNLQTRDAVFATFTTMRDIAGNTVTATTAGVDAVTDTVAGDDQAPMLLSIAEGTGDTILMTFDEEVRGLETLDLEAGPNPTGTEVTLTDVSDPGTAASGTIAMSGTPDDGTSITISDGTTSVAFEFDYATGSVTVGGDPNDTDSVAIGDGTLSLTFEFESGGGITGDVSVAIAAGDSITTASNLATAINGSALTMTATPNPSALSEVLLAHDSAGTAGNVAITATDTAGVLTLAGMTGGGIAGDISVSVDQASIANTITNLRTAIDGHAFNVTTSNGSAAEDFALANDSSGTAGNVALSVTDPAGVLATTGLAGGTAAGTATFEPSASTSAATPTHATVTYSITPAAFDTLRVYGVLDLAGNQMPPELGFAVVAADATVPSLDAATQIYVAPGEFRDQVQITFDVDMSTVGLDDLANYTLSDGSGPIDMTGSDVTTGLRTVTITLPESVHLDASETFTITANNVSSVQGVERTSADTLAGATVIGDTAVPALGAGGARLDPIDPDSVLVEFDEPVDVAGAAPANYTIVGNTTTAVTMVHPCVARVTFQTSPSVSDNLDVAVAALTDFAGNQAAGVATVAVASADATAPTVVGVAGDNTAFTQHSVSVTFSEPVDLTAATNATNYAVSYDGGAPIDLTGCTFQTDTAQNFVRINLAEGTYLAAGETISVTVSNVTDVASNTIVPAASTAPIGGDTTAPTTAAAFMNDKEDATLQTVEFTFAEPMDVATTTDIANWTGSGGQAATSVVALNRTSFRVAFDAAIGTSDTIDVATPTDVAGNVGATITVNPVE